MKILTTILFILTPLLVAADRSEYYSDMRFAIAQAFEANDQCYVLSDDTDKAKLQCEKAFGVSLDHTLNKVYGDVIRELGSSQEKAKFRAEQRDWARGRYKLCRGQAGYEGIKEPDISQRLRFKICFNSFAMGRTSTLLDLYFSPSL